HAPAPHTTGPLGSYDTGAHHHADYPPPAPQGGAQPYPAFGPAGSEPAPEPPRPAHDTWEQPAWSSGPSGGQPSFRDPAGTPPAFGTPPAPADGTPGGYGPSPYTTGPLGSYDTGAHHHADYPPPAPQGGAQPYPAPERPRPEPSPRTRPAAHDPSQQPPRRPRP